MRKEIDDFQQWLGRAAAEIPNANPSSKKEGHSPEKRTEVEEIVEKIESIKVDIAPGYNEWLKIGLCFADAFGEEGRDLFHRVSRFYPGYTDTECNKKYDDCLNTTGIRVTLKTFFWLAREAGIDIGSGPDETEEDVKPMPTFPDSLFPHLPLFTRGVVSAADTKEERDLMLLGTITVISACLPNVYGIYDGRKVYPNLFLFITAQASAGKGRLVHCKQLVEPIHNALRAEVEVLREQYQEEMAEYNAQKGKKNPSERPKQPPELMLFIPANSSTTGVFQLLADNRGRGLIFESEGDTMTLAFKSDFGNYSDGFRKAFHHETISYYRRTDREYVDIQNPCMSAVLSGTPTQVAGLIPNSENGLFSRFMFYYMNTRPQWKNVFSKSAKEGLDVFFEGLGKEFLTLHETLQGLPEIHFQLSQGQEERFNLFFEGIQNQYLTLQGIDYVATIRRLGLIAFRISMVLTALRIAEHGNTGPLLECEDRDFDTALAMIRVLVKHAAKVFAELPAEDKPPGRKNKKERFFTALPQSFNRQKYLEVASKTGINPRTVERYITQFVKSGLIHRDQKDLYLKPETENQGEGDQKGDREETAEIEETAETDVKKEPGPPGEAFP